MPGHQTTKDEVLITRKDVEAVTGYSCSSIYNLMSDPVRAFPRPIKIGAAARWRKHDVQEWIKARITESQSA